MIFKTNSKLTTTLGLETLQRHLTTVCIGNSNVLRLSSTKATSGVNFIPQIQSTRIKLSNTVQYFDFRARAMRHLARDVLPPRYFMF